MKTSIFAAAATLLFAAFVSATPAPLSDLTTTPYTLEPRCESCDEACPKTHFYYKPKNCCLQSGGPKNPPSPPQNKGCPSYWYWNGDKKCCTPRYPQLSYSQPTCGTTTLPWWDNNNHCCTKPPTGTNPPPSGSSPRPKRDAHQPKSKYTGRKAEIKNRQNKPCPAHTFACPMGKYGSGTLECLDSFNEIHACGGCPAHGIGRDCTTIANSVNVGCEAPDDKPAFCVVSSCKDGFTPSKDGKSCVAA